MEKTSKSYTDRYEQGVLDERKRIIGLLTEAGKELFTISKFGKLRNRRKAKATLLIIANTIDYIQESVENK
jgi:hypothetical protein